MTIGDRIKKSREENKITQEELAKHINSTKQTIYKYENNIITNIPSDKVENIAKALGVSPSYLMGWEEINFSEKTLKVLKEFDEIIDNKKPTRGETAVAANIYLEKKPVDLKDIPEKHHNNIISLIDLFKEIEELEPEDRVKLREYINKLELEKDNKITQLPKKQESKEYLLPDAANEIAGATEENIKNDNENIMDDPNF